MYHVLIAYTTPTIPLVTRAVSSHRKAILSAFNEYRSGFSTLVPTKKLLRTCKTLPYSTSMLHLLLLQNPPCKLRSGVLAHTESGRNLCQFAHSGVFGFQAMKLRLFGGVLTGTPGHAEYILGSIYILGLCKFGNGFQITDTLVLTCSLQ